MKIALISDIHANWPALQAVLAHLDQSRPDAVYCLGDLVGYCTWPNEVIAEIRRRGIPTIAGNYDHGVGLASDDCGCAYKTEQDRANGAISIALTNQWVGPDERRYLKALPRHIRIDLEQQGQPFSILLVHGSPRRINEYLFEDRPEASLLRILHDAQADVLCFGHTHRPFHRPLADPQGGTRHAVNVGSVGKPKDGDPSACYAILHLDPERGPQEPGFLSVSFERVPYDVEQAARAVEASGLPHTFADMLRKAY